jgi:hypothetical protein|tara:strand:+ start:3058 stop:3276 length:219 start_codon:yes stop_codon:yes gene_type:complete
MKPGTQVKLKGKSKHGKNRIQQFGGDFWVSEVRDRLQTTTHKNLPGPFLMVFSETGDNRWVALNDDPDFEVQ